MSALRIAVCVATYRRPRGLFALLGALEQQSFEGAPPEIRVVVVDNDARGSARSVCESAKTWLRHPLHYVVEKRLGIPAARNTALAAAMDSDWIAFVDDDETPEPHWLAALLRAQAEHEADVVGGPVAPDFVEPPARWIAEGRFFESERFPDGARLSTAYTNNVLVRTQAIAGLASLFDERMAPNGEDTELFDRLRREGARIVWASRAVVRESVPPDRARLSWLLRRSFRIGLAESKIASLRLPLARRAAWVLAHGGWCIVRGLGTTAGGLVAGATQAGRGLWLASYGLGRLTGLVVADLGRPRPAPSTGTAERMTASSGRGGA